MAAHPLASCVAKINRAEDHAEWMEDRRVARTLRQLGERERDIITQLQPVNAQTPSEHPLAVLPRLDDEDKHRALAVIVVLPRNASFDAMPVKDCNVLERVPNLGVHLTSRTEIGRIHIEATGPFPEVHVEAKFVPELHFSDGPLVLARFQELQRFVFNDVLAPLAPDLLLSFPRAEVPTGT